ncbi:hypothetical protein HPP92_018344 [Vanilla planifolia]|uniref:Phototropic-responsive NPH3 family protein n=1 Tax=Vanilla planifolia TaxID=51239 RepID=A0A835UKQ5_VANPL|nr:hypothetical protein HPP92_018344 [Vanilla planifolia]
MKFMKLGSKPDLFQSEGSNVRFVSADLATDLVVVVDEVKFHLHKFPLISKSYRLQRLVLDSSNEGMDEVNMHDFPGGQRAFEICAKFCYGMTVTLSAYNVVAVRCAAEYLEMIETIEKGNLIYKIEVFLNSSVFRSWKDSIIALQSTGSLLPWSEELKIPERCIDAIASKTSMDPSGVHWSYAYNRRMLVSDQISEFHQKNAVPMDWWVEDICELDINLYRRVILAIKSKGRMSSDVILKALEIYTMRWLQDSYDSLAADDYMKKNKSLVQTIVWLLPSDSHSECSCRFLLKLLKVVIMVDAGNLLKEELINKVSAQLDKASAKDLLITSSSSDGTAYNVDLVQSLVKRFLILERSACDGVYIGSEISARDQILSPVSLFNLGKLIDGYLVEIGRDPNLPMSSFIDLAHLLPDEARPTHDGLYTAIDVFLKEHADLTKAEKKKICSLLDVRKLTPEASIAAAQNERLPLRVVVRIVFFEQLRMAATGTLTIPKESILNGSPRLTGGIEECGEELASDRRKPLEKQSTSLKSEEHQRPRREAKNGSAKDTKSRGGGLLLLSSRSRRMLDKFWAGKLPLGDNNRSSETSGSSRSPPTSANPAEATTTSGSSSRHRRHSVS